MILVKILGKASPKFLIDQSLEFENVKKSDNFSTCMHVREYMHIYWAKALGLSQSNPKSCF